MYNIIKTDKGKRGRKTEKGKERTKKEENENLKERKKQSGRYLNKTNKKSEKGK